jgi:hypothetical protein
MTGLDMPEGPQRGSCRQAEHRLTAWDVHPVHLGVGDQPVEVRRGGLEGISVRAAWLYMAGTYTDQLLSAERCTGNDSVLVSANDTSRMRADRGRRQRVEAAEMATPDASPVLVCGRGRRQRRQRVRHLQAVWECRRGVRAGGANAVHISKESRIDEDLHFRRRDSLQRVA